MPYVVVVYDVSSDRTGKPRKLLRQHLQHVQNSVFEGNITEANLEKVMSELKDILENDESIIIYDVWSDKYINRTTLGDDPLEDHRFL